VSSVSFSPDGTRIVSGSSDSTVRVWDAATGLPFGEPFQGHTSSVLSVSFSPDGTRIVSGSRDSTVRVWDAATAQPFQEHTEINSSVSLNNGWVVSPDGQLLFWVPPASREIPFHSPGTVLAIPSGQEIDLSRIAHGEHWSNCRDP
ncbi:WD40-repeat-containing domain protein, partial [Suillus americanus]